MKKYNKILIASQLFERAHDQLISARTEIDYASSLLLSGAVVGIISPVLEEQGGHPMHDLLVQIANAISEPGEKKVHVGLFRLTYNSLKHSGNKRNNLPALEDLEFETDLRLEASRMLDVAKADFNQIVVSSANRQQCSDSFLALLDSEHEYA